jgi:predicted amidohydrolase YtcJ
MRYAVLLLSVLTVSALSVARAADQASLILHGGKVVTVDKAFTIAEAIALKGDRILAVGSNHEVLKLRGPATETIDLAGQMVLPGLMDSHVHPHSAALHEFDHAVPDMETVEDILAYVKSRAAALAPGEWITVRQVFITRLKEPRYPTRAELDAAAPQHPVVFSTGPDAVLNTLALQASGIDKNFQVQGTGSVEKDPATGEPTGLLRSCARYIKSKPSGKEPTQADRLARLELLFRDYNSVGLTAVADRNAGFDDIARYQQLHAEQRLTLRIRASVSVDNQASVEATRARLKEISRHPARQENAWVHIVGVKTFLDGGMLTGSAYLREPWGVSEIYSITDPQYRGVLFLEPEKLEQMVSATVVEGLQFTAHSVGDGAVHALLAAYEKVNARTPVEATRPCLTHSNFMSREAVEQMVQLGVVADLQPAWLYLDASVLTRQFGNERLRYFQPLKTMFERGAIAGGGSDHMQKIGSFRSVNPYNPFLGMWIAIRRQPRWFEGTFHAEEALSREQALRLYTSNNAYVMFLDDEAGSLEPGKLGDLIVVDRDLLTCPIDDLRDTQVLRTYVGGKLVHRQAKPAVNPQ